MALVLFFPALLSLSLYLIAGVDEAYSFHKLTVTLVILGLVCLKIHSELGEVAYFIDFALLFLVLVVIHKVSIKHAILSISLSVAVIFLLLCMFSLIMSF